MHWKMDQSSEMRISGGTSTEGPGGYYSKEGIGECPAHGGLSASEADSADSWMCSRLVEKSGFDAARRSSIIWSRCSLYYWKPEGQEKSSSTKVGYGEGVSCVAVCGRK